MGTESLELSPLQYGIYDYIIYGECYANVFIRARFVTYDNFGAYLSATKGNRILGAEF